MELDAILQKAHEADASDVHIIAGEPPTVRIHQVITPLTEQALTQDEVAAMFEQMSNKFVRARFDEERDVDFSYEVEDLARYRVNVHMQRGMIGMAMRAIQTTVPPLAALKAFEAAARLGAFKLAADELHVTPSAVSHQVRALEEWLDVPLFERKTRRIELTSAARDLLPDLSGAFDLMASGCARVAQNTAPPSLTLSVAHTFANGWLVSRLPDFQLTEPDIEVRLLLASTQLETHFASPDVDAAITHGQSQVLRDMRSHRLMSETLELVCAPSVAARLNDMSDLHHETLLQVLPRMGQWRAWMSLAQVDGIDPDRGPRFQSTPLALEAALAGAGVAIANPRFIQNHLRAGRLVRPFAVGLPSDSAYYLVYRTSQADAPHIVAFRNWLLGTIDVDDELDPESEERLQG